MTTAETVGPLIAQHLTLKQAAEVAAMKPWFIRMECRRGHLPHIRLSARAIRISVVDLQAYLAARRMTMPRPAVAKTSPVRPRRRAKSR